MSHEPDGQILLHAVAIARCAVFRYSAVDEAIELALDSACILAQERGLTTWRKSSYPLIAACWAVVLFICEGNDAALKSSLEKLLECLRQLFLSFQA